MHVSPKEKKYHEDYFILFYLYSLQFADADPDNSGTDGSAHPFLTQSVFHWSVPQILTASTAGSIVVWNMLEDLTTNQSQRVNLVDLQQEPITVLTVTDG